MPRGRQPRIVARPATDTNEPGLEGPDDAAALARWDTPTRPAAEGDRAPDRSGRHLALLPTPRAQAREYPYPRDDYHHNLEEWVGHYVQGTLRALDDSDPDAGWFGSYSPAIAQWEQILGRRAPDPIEPAPTDGTPRLSPRFVEFAMGLPSGHVTNPAIGLSPKEQIKALGNGVVPQQAALALRTLLGLGGAVAA